MAIIVLSAEPTLLYLLGEPKDPVAVWKKLSDNFLKKTWANKLALRRRLFKESESVQEHSKKTGRLKLAIWSETPSSGCHYGLLKWRA